MEFLITLRTNNSISKISPSLIKMKKTIRRMPNSTILLRWNNPMFFLLLAFINLLKR